MKFNYGTLDFDGEELFSAESLLANGVIGKEHMKAKCIRRQGGSPPFHENGKGARPSIFIWRNLAFAVVLSLFLAFTIYSTPKKNQGIVDLPENGTGYLLREANDNLASFKIISSEEYPDLNFLVFLMDWNTGATVIETFVRGGQSVDVLLPLGSYRIMYAKGGGWYGYEKLFGSKTVVIQIKKPMNISHSGPNKKLGANFTLKLSGDYVIFLGH